MTVTLKNGNKIKNVTVNRIGEAIIVYVKCFGQTVIPMKDVERITEDEEDVT